ncbi:MAG: glycosyltransferase [Pelagibacteraceae bacterium]|jgi:glycosyltransferase involved in cell wall biosynthesis|nr:glycosyltransferase [Pelagibacteraceae bacterium]MDP6710163.1 glycosyltransferase [Pelagibacteraceae bacterium]
MFSVIIPTFNNIDYLKICLKSLKKNSKFDNEIILHVNEGIDGTLDFVKKNKINYSHSHQNIGLCSSVNIAAEKISTDYIIYGHDDMYFCPDWDVAFEEEINKIGHNFFYLSGTMIQPLNGHIQLNCGKTHSDFDEKKLLSEYKSLNYHDFQGTHWSPHLIHKDVWNSVGGLSEEFNPGIGSDPDLNMKLWKKNVRIFKGLSNSRVYHFGSISLRKKKSLKRNRGSKIFLKKWGISVSFFLKYYLNGSEYEFNKCIITKKYTGPLKNPKISFFYLIELLFCKLNYIYNKYF